MIPKDTQPALLNEVIVIGKNKKRQIMNLLIIRFLIILIIGVFSNMIVSGQEIITYHINERDTALYCEEKQEYEQLKIKSNNSGMAKTIRELSLNDSCEMYVVRIEKENVIIQNWEYRDLSMIKNSTNVYGILRVNTKDNIKDFLICYKNHKDRKQVRKLYYKKKEKIHYTIKYRSLPDDDYIIQNDIVTYYLGILIHNDIQFQKKIYNNRDIE